MDGCRRALCLFPSLSVWLGVGRREEHIDLLTGFNLSVGWWHLESCPSRKWTSFGSKRNSDNGISVGLPCSEGCKTSKMRFGNDRFAVYGILYIIKSVNDIFGMTKNYSRGLQIILIGTLIDNSSYSCLIEIKKQTGLTSDSPTYMCESWSFGAWILQES